MAAMASWKPQARAEPLAGVGLAVGVGEGVAFTWQKGVPFKREGMLKRGDGGVHMHTFCQGGIAREVPFTGH